MASNYRHCLWRHRHRSYCCPINGNLNGSISCRRSDRCWSTNDCVCAANGVFHLVVRRPHRTNRPRMEFQWRRRLFCECDCRWFWSELCSPRHVAMVDCCVALDRHRNQVSERCGTMGLDNERIQKRNIDKSADIWGFSREESPLPVMPVLVLGIGKRVGDCGGLSITWLVPCPMGLDEDGLPVSLSESSSDDESSDSEKGIFIFILSSETELSTCHTVICIILHFGNASIASKWWHTHVLIVATFGNILWQFPIAVIAIAVSGSVSSPLSKWNEN